MRPHRLKVLPENWWQHPAALGATDSDIEIIKRQWGVRFTVRIWSLQLRRRGIDTIVLCGISTNIGVESTARNARELGFNLVIAEDACGAASAEQHTITALIISTRASPVRAVWKRSSALSDLHRSTANGSHPKWVRLDPPALEEVCPPLLNCVEGNTTLYRPAETRGCPALGVNRPQMTSASVLSFRRPFPHQAALRHCDDLVTEFFDPRMSPLAPRIGQYWLQLPATFGPRELPALWHFLDSLLWRI